MTTPEQESGMPDDAELTAPPEGAPETVEETDPFFAWLRANAEFAESRPDTGVLALYLSTVTAQSDRRAVLADRTRYLTMISTMREESRVQDTLEQAIPASITALLTRFQHKLLQTLWPREGELVPYADIHRACSRTKKVGGGNEVLLGPMKDFRRRIRNLGIGVIFSVEGKGYLFLSNHHTGLSSRALWSLFRAGHGGQSAAVMAPLLKGRPEVVPNGEILASMGPLRDAKGHTQSRALGQLITKQVSKLNESSVEHFEFVVQPDRQVGYRSYTSEEIPAEWIHLMHGMKLWTREADVFIHLLSRGDELVTVEELIAVSRHDTPVPDHAFRRFMQNVKAKAEKAGCAMTPEYEITTTGKPLKGFRFRPPEGSHGYAVHLSASDRAWQMNSDPELDDAYKLTREDEVQAFHEIEQARKGMLHVCKAIASDAGEHWGEMGKPLGLALSAISFETHQDFWAHIKMYGTGKLLHLLKTVDQILMEQGMEPRQAQKLSFQRHALKSYMDSYAVRQNRLLESMKRWAYREANGFARRKRVPEDRFPDYQSCALMGVTKAIDRFDHRRGTRLSTYATWRIKSELGKEWERVDSGPRSVSLDQSFDSSERKSDSLATRVEDTREQTPGDHHETHRTELASIFGAAKGIDAVALQIFERVRGISINPETGVVQYAQREPGRVVLKDIAAEFGVSTVTVRNKVDQVMKHLRRAAKGLGMAERNDDADE